jgi:hypothetical protein
MFLPVGLIQNKVCATSEVGLSHLQDVNESARCGNDDLAAVLQVTNLSALWSTSEDTGAEKKLIESQAQFIKMDIFVI